MKLSNIFAIASSVVVTVALSAAAQRAPVKVQLHDAQGQSVGTAELSPAPQGVTIRLDLHNLSEGEHAIHIHQVAKCEAPGFTSAGPHLNRDAMLYRLQIPEGPHAGAILNIKVGPKGDMKGTIVAPGVTMGDDSHSVFSNGGTALVIHAKADDMKSDPAGNAGDRIVCGMIAKP